MTQLKLILMAVLLSLAGTVGAQSTMTICAKVHDQNGNDISGTNIRLDLFNGETKLSEHDAADNGVYYLLAEGVTGNPMVLKAFSRSASRYVATSLPVCFVPDRILGVPSPVVVQDGKPFHIGGFTEEVVGPVTWKENGYLFEGANLLIKENGKLTITGAGITQLGDICIEAGNTGKSGELNASDATALTSVGNLKIVKTIQPSSEYSIVWNAICLPFENAIVTDRSNRVMRPGTWTSKTFSPAVLTADTYAALTYDGASRAANGTNDPRGLSNWRFDTQGKGVLIASSQSQIVFSTASPEEALALVKTAGKTFDLAEHPSTLTDGDRHKGWNLVGSGKLHSTYQFFPEGISYAQVWNGAGWTPDNFFTNTPSPLTPFFVQATTSGQVVTRGTGEEIEPTRTFALELRTATDQLIDRAYLTLGTHRAGLNVGKFRQGNEACVWILADNYGWCALNSENTAGDTFTLRVKNNGMEGTKLVVTQCAEGYEVETAPAIVASTDVQSVTVKIRATATGIGTTDDEACNVFGTKGAVVLENAIPGSNYLVYNLSGITVANGTIGESRSTVILPAGSYVVAIGSRRVKVVVLR